jgi:hypothetical protein
MTVSTIGYDGQIQPRMVYDAPSLPTFGYDVAPTFLTNERKTRHEETGNTFARFAKLLAAKGVRQGCDPGTLSAKGWR